MFLPQPFLISPFFCFSFSVSLLLLSFFLPSCLSFLLSFCFLFLSLFHFSFFFAFVFRKEQLEHFRLQFIFFINLFSFFMVSCLVFPFKSLFLIFVFFPDFKLCFLFNMNVFGFQTTLKKHNSLVKRGVATKRFFFINLCFAKCEKLSFFFAPFLPNFG